VDDLIAFLRAQLDEDERIARAVEDRSAPWDGQWMADGNSAVRTLNGHVLFYRHDSGPLEPGLVDHVVRHDPARVLREIDAKRRILAEHALNGWVCDTCDNGEVEQVFPCRTLRLLALPYADRPGYLDSWRP
jgi:hypothetical protein